LRKLLTFAAIVEIGTGLALLIDPALVVRLLVGGSETGEGMPLARFPGIALLALGMACWPSAQRVESGAPVVAAMLTYNVLVALFLAYVFMVKHMGGVLLWPAVALHAVVALMLAWRWCDERPAKATEK
jgi:drug/metabolite transporter (DMT)-like permease